VPPRAPQVKSLDLGSPFASKANVVAYDRHVLFTSNDPADATRHCAPCPISTTRFDEAFIHEMPEDLVGLVFAQAELVAYACDLGVGIYLVPSALTLVDSPEHLSALVVGKLCRHYAPLPLVPPIVRLPDRTATCPYAPLPRRPLSYAMSCIFIPPSASRHTLNGSAVVLIDVRRRSVGRDNGARRRTRDGAIFEDRQVCFKNRPFGGCIAPGEVVALSATTPHKSVGKGVQEMQLLQIEHRISIEQVPQAIKEE
jgi:hypothetical protein